MLPFVIPSGQAPVSFASFDSAYAMCETIKPASPFWKTLVWTSAADAAH